MLHKITTIIVSILSIICFCNMSLAEQTQLPDNMNIFNNTDKINTASNITGVRLNSYRPGETLTLHLYDIPYNTEGDTTTRSCVTVRFTNNGSGVDPTHFNQSYIVDVIRRDVLKSIRHGEIKRSELLHHDGLDYSIWDEQISQNLQKDLSTVFKKSGFPKAALLKVYVETHGADGCSYMTNSYRDQLQHTPKNNIQ